MSRGLQEWIRTPGVEADLHVHTTASDGAHSPVEVVSLACEAGLKAVAITDHDSVEGVAEALNASGDLEVVPGVELSTEWQGQEAHILGFFIDHCSAPLLEKLVEMRASRRKRAGEMIAKLCALGYPVTMEEVQDIAGDGSFGRPHIARALQARGYIDSVGEAFERFIGRGRPAYVERYKMTPEEAVELIHRAGGVPALAHPGILNGVGELLPSLVQVGLRGLEVFYPEHDHATMDRLGPLAGELGLVATGGSDFHGLKVVPHPLGSAGVDLTVVKALKNLSGGVLA